MSIDRVKEFFSEPPEPAGRRIGRYEIIREIARGGMAVVYQALDPALGRRVALKVLKEGNRERLQREAAAAAKLRHPNVVTVHEVGPDFIAMDLLLGKTLAESMEALKPAERLAVVETVARAVAHAHEQGVIHRDLKPQNILIEPDGRVVLTDFGLARIEGGEDLTRTGAVFGTPHYMAPEQVQGLPSGPATDVWALGVLLHEAVRGARPFEVGTSLALYDRIVREDPPPLPGDLGAIAAKALEKDSSRRYPNAGAFAEDLAKARRGEPVSVRPAGPLSRLARKLRRNPAPAVMAVVVLVAGLLAAARQIEHARALRSLRDTARVSLDAALELRRAGAVGQMRKFLPPLEEAWRDAGEGAEASYLLGRFHRALLEDAKALECQERALKGNADYRPARYERAVLIALRDGRPALEEAARSPESWRAPVVEDARRVLESPPQEIGPGGLLVSQGLVAYGSGNLPKARQSFEEALALDPLLEEARELLTAVIRTEILPSFEETLRRTQQAEDLFTQGLARDRGYLPHYLGRGELRWTRGSRRRHRGLDPMPDYRAAEADFSEALRLDPRSARAWQWRGQARVYQGIWFLETDQDPSAAWDSAEADLNRAVELQPSFSGNWLWRGNARFYRGFWKAGKGRDPLADFEAAGKDLSEAVARALEPSTERRWRGRLRAQQAGALARAGRDASALFDEAEADFVAALKQSERDSWFWTWRSTVWSERALARMARGENPLPDFQRAEEFIGRALDIDRTLMEGWKHRGFVRWQRAAQRLAAGDRAGARDDYAAAAADFLEALSINPTLKYQIGDRADAARRKAAELDAPK
ncbi:MAG: serine/threonine protein kinase [Planctomycetes bacterium]|nr:serine/threonine protein kinase [Planctomycetota bacterium]